MKVKLDEGYVPQSKSYVKATIFIVDVEAPPSNTIYYSKYMMD